MRLAWFFLLFLCPFANATNQSKMIEWIVVDFAPTT